MEAGWHIMEVLIMGDDDRQGLVLQICANKTGSRNRGWGFAREIGSEKCKTIMGNGL